MKPGPVKDRLIVAAKPALELLQSLQRWVTFTLEELEVIDNLDEAILRAEYFRHGPEPRTHCLRGHPYAGKNLLIAQGQRRCRTCIREGKARRRKLAARRPPS